MQIAVTATQWKLRTHAVTEARRGQKYPRLWQTFSCLRIKSSEFRARVMIVWTVTIRRGRHSRYVWPAEFQGQPRLANISSSVLVFPLRVFLKNPFYTNFKKKGFLKELKEKAVDFCIVFCNKAIYSRKTTF